MNYSIISCDNILHIIDEDAFPVCHLDDEKMQSLSEIEGINCSACILQLASYGIMPTNVLYQVASHIQKRFGDLRIDWFTTFYHVEKNSYLNIAFSMKEWLEQKGIFDDETRFSRYIEFQKNEPIDCLDTILLKIVMMNIINFDVKIR